MQKIAYITTSFGAASHTFIRREVLELRSLGLHISLFGVHRQIARGLSDKEKDLCKETVYLYPIKIGATLLANIWFAVNLPAGYFNMLRRAILNEETNVFRHIKLIYHFFVSAYIAAKLRKVGITHIHSHFMNVSAAIAMYAAGLCGISYSVTVHSAGTKGESSRLGFSGKVKYAKFLCAISDYTFHYYDKIFNCADKTFIVHCGIDPDNYKKNPGYSFPSKDAEVRLISVGRLEEKKGFIYLIEACRHLACEGVKFEAIILGSGSLLNCLRQKVRGCGLSGKVVFKGECSQETVKADLGNSDICVVPSVTAKTGETEGIPVIIMEAMAMEVPVVATKHAGIPEIVKDRETGLLVPERDSSTIAEAIKLFIKDENLKNLCTQNGRKIVLEEFNIKKTAGLKKMIFEENA